SDPRITTMTDEKIALRTLLEKGSDATFLREMIGFAAQRVMELESEALCGAGHGERSVERRNQRNGYRDRDWETRAGTVELRIPKPGFWRCPPSPGPYQAERHQCRGSLPQAGRVGRHVLSLEKAVRRDGRGRDPPAEGSGSGADPLRLPGDCTCCSGARAGLSMTEMV